MTPEYASFFRRGPRGPARAGDGAEAATDAAAAAPHRADAPAPPRTLDELILAILAAPLAPGETASVGFLRKERELGELFASLSPAEARALHARLAAARAGDAVVAAFARMTLDRRTRLLEFLADARRREALALARPRRAGTSHR